MTARTPTALKVLRGTDRKDRANPDEPKPATGAKPPPWLPRTGPARSAWRRLAPILEASRILTVADAEALALGCVALADYLAARGERDGWRRADAAWKRYLAALRDFGLTPASRSKVSAVAPAAELDPLEAWEAGRQAHRQEETRPDPPRLPRSSPPPAASGDDSAAWAEWLGRR